MSTMNYKGYIGSIEVSEEDNCLFGKVLDLPSDTAITYEGETVAELKADFEGAVDDYLAYCKEAGIQHFTGHSFTHCGFGQQGRHFHKRIYSSDA